MRFALDQHGKIRLIDNGANGLNETFGSEETIHTTSSAAAATLARCYRKHVGRRLSKKWLLEGSSRDMKSAYRQLATNPKQRHLVIVAVWDIIVGRWRFSVANALLFGLSGAVLHFNRVPTALVAFLRRWFALLVQAFFDDFRIVEASCCKDSAPRWFDKVLSWLGWKFDPVKNQGPLLTLPLLGNIEFYGECGVREALTIGAKPERVAEIRTEISRIRGPGLAQRVRPQP